ncbi:GNAT family N-acetyltransferase [Candidatus Thorarchaeota archaeon]|nr:MAG: GNAT family N-acetyltransferase [Candidatus Thorarchaeota archaeon]
MDLIKEIIVEAYEPIRKQLSRMPAALEEGLGKISRHIQMGDQYVGIVGDTVVATMRIRLVGKVGVVSRVGIRQSYRGRRIGSMLIEYAENLMIHSNATVIEVEIYGVVEAQLDFYKRLGYKETGRMERLGEEIVVMQKSLVEPDQESEF